MFDMFLYGLIFGAGLLLGKKLVQAIGSFVFQISNLDYPFHYRWKQALYYAWFNFFYQD